ncbi:hypothetical protein LG293_17320 (plasmid) [Citricoccus nitrophenolicus]
MSLTVTALKLAEHLTDPWAAHDALRPALKAALEDHRADWIGMMAEGGKGPMDAWETFHNDRKISEMFSHEASVVLIRDRRRLLGVVHGPRDTLDFLVGAGLGTDFSADSRSGYGSYKTWDRLADTPGAVTWSDLGLVVEAKIRYTDLWEIPDADGLSGDQKVRAYLDAQPGRS